MIFAQKERLVGGGAKSERSLVLQSLGLTSPPLPYQGGSLFESSNSLQAIAMIARFKYRFQSSLQRITIICILHTGNKNIWEGDILRG